MDSSWTEGTFNRQKFFDCCRTFALNNTQIQRYPGFHSVWILDGARIHCNSNIIRYLRSIGIIPMFLPPYCPFFNPIVLIFGLIKSHLRRHHRENESVMHEVCEAMNSIKIYPCQKIFENCGYLPRGVFLPQKGHNQDPKYMRFNVGSS